LEGYRRNRHSFLTKYDNMLFLAGAAVEGRGEDSFFCSGPETDAGPAVIGVFDGSGGLGGRMHREMGGYNEAYLGSRILSGALCDWYEDHKKELFYDGETITKSVGEYFSEAFGILSSKTTENRLISGSLVRSFPTTAAIAMALNNQRGVLLHIIWAGDSRVYLLDEEGLAQLTVDDVLTTDAFENLRSDDSMTNVLSSDGKYTLHHKQILINRPTMVIAATDGCYGYIPSPMEFEYELLSNLMEASTPNDYTRRLGILFDEVAGDDYTMGVLDFYFGTFQNQKKLLSDRLKEVTLKYSRPLSDCRRDQPKKAQDMARALWNEYRIGYERYFEGLGGERI